jgi:transcriptional regulator GlxA family with amidase domain
MPSNAASSAIKTREDREITVAILLYENITPLDAIGPYDVLRRLPGARVTFVAEQPGPKQAEGGGFSLVAEHALAEVPHPGIVLVPGGGGQTRLMTDGAVHEWLRASHRTSTWTTSVCTGSLILAAAGLLAGKQATSHWLALEELGSLGAKPSQERVVFDGKLVTAAGVSAGIDMALSLAALIAGDRVAQAIQLGIEYDPQPQFDAGSPRKAPTEVVELLRTRSRFVR